MAQPLETLIPNFPRYQPSSRKEWRSWLGRNHRSSTGIWLVYAKKHTQMRSVTYDEAVEEALCFGWIDSKKRPIDHDLYMQVFTPRKAKSLWSALNRARVERLVTDGSMTPAGMAMVELAKRTGTWTALASAESLDVPPDLRRALRSVAGARRNWLSYSPSMRKAFLYRLLSAKRPETRARYLKEIVDRVAHTTQRRRPG